jgi:hypothetical protein
VKVSHTWSLSRPFPYPDSQAQVKRIYDSFGPQRLMWGTDWPLVESYCGYGKGLSGTVLENQRDHSSINMVLIPKIVTFFTYYKYRIIPSLNAAGMVRLNTDGRFYAYGKSE